MVEMLRSNASDMLVRSMYEIVYMISATGMIRSQRSDFTALAMGEVSWAIMREKSEKLWR